MSTPEAVEVFGAAALPSLTPGQDCTFYTSDHHFLHKNIGVLADRPLPYGEMEECMVERWNSVVPPWGKVIHVGDFSLSMSALHFVSRLNGSITLVAGNHDLCWEGMKNKPKAQRAVQRYLDAGFAEVIPSGQMVHTIRGQEVLISHLPYVGDSRHDERYAELRPKDEGLPLICGHVHTAWRRLYGGDGRVHDGQVHVGVDVWDFFPVPEPVVADLLGLAE